MRWGVFSGSPMVADGAAAPATPATAASTTGGACAAGSASTAGSTGDADHAQAVLLHCRHCDYFICIEHKQLIQVYWPHGRPSPITMNKNRQMTVKYARHGYGRPTQEEAVDIAMHIIEGFANGLTKEELKLERDNMVNTFLANKLVTA